MTEPRFPIVRVRWIDSVLLAGWKALGDLPTLEPVVAETAGYLVHSDETEIMVASGVHGDDAAGIIRIPRACIQGTVTAWTGEVDG